jgi:GAF domain-containing protein
VNLKGPLIVPDAAADPRFAANPWVLDGSTRFYIGVPIQIDGCGLGALCVVDRKPREPRAGDVESLEALGRIIMALLNKCPTVDNKPLET